MIVLNKKQQITHGSPLGLAAVASRFKPSAESYTAVIEDRDESPCLLGQVVHANGARSAHLNFVAAHEDKGFSELWDELSSKAGEMGAVNVLAELEETSPLFESLRKAGYVPYGWEIAWKLPAQINSSEDNQRWQISGPTDEPQMRSLYQSLVPPIVQAAEAFANGGTRRLVYKENGEILAYVESSSGPNGLYLRPLIHPSVVNVTALLTELACQFSNLGQPVYIQVRSYQAWLLESLQSIGGESFSHFALMAKHLTVQQRNGVIVNQRKLVEKHHAEPSTPIINNMATDDPTLPQA